jgi:phage tail protein X
MSIEGNRVGWEGEPGRVDVDFAYPDGLVITQTDQYDPPPAEWRNWDLGEWHLSAETPEPASQQEFVTFVAVQGAAAAIDAAHSVLPRNITVTLPDGAATVALEDAAFTVVLPGAEPQTFAESR